MSMLVCGGAVLQCSFGDAPSLLMVLPKAKVNCIMPAATVMDHIPILNILPFVMCKSMMNPMVVAATAAAMGVLTPMPCIPVTVSPWSPGSTTVQIGGQAALKNDSKLNCAWGGCIEIKMPGQFQALVP